MNRFTAVLIIFSLFIISILLRLVNLDRPISKHHEFNTAVVLINIQSWREAGGGSKLNFVPILNFQNPGDKFASRSYYSVDSAGNVMYLSFGPAWYIIPYLIYELFHLPAEPIYLQCINLVFNLASVILFFYLLELLIPASAREKYFIMVAGCYLFMYSPGILWFLGNGYINIGIMMPFVIGALLLLIPMLRSAENISAGKLTALGVLIVLLIYFDWFILALCAVASMYALLKIKKDRKYLLLLLIVALSAIAGILLLFLQFASYAGWQAVSEYWAHRFHSRSVVNTSTSFWKMAAYVAFNFITSYLPVFIILAIAFVLGRSKKIKFFFSENEILFLKIYTLSVSLYNMALFEWSYEHEFSLIPWSILFSYLAAKAVIALFQKKQLYGLMLLFFLAAMSQYYFINRPGKISREGTPYFNFKKFGDSLKRVPPDYKIFLDIVPDPMIEYYAGRNIYPIRSMDDAKQFMHRWGISKAVWVEHDKLDFQKIIVIDAAK
jgi:hypothetical protein